MGTTVLLRSRSAQTLGAVMIAAAALGLGTAVVDGPTALLQFGAPTVLFGLLGWAGFVQPSVEVSDGGVTVANTWRTVEVPWPAVESVDGRYGLRLATTYGPVTAWGAAAPVGRQRARGQQSAAGAVVEQRLADLREAGHLDDARLERAGLRTTWHPRLLIAAGVLALASAVLPLLA